MFVCICHGITDTQIKQAIANGAGNLAEIKQQLGIGDQCGKCIKLATQLIRAETNAQPNYYQVA